MAIEFSRDITFGQYLDLGSPIHRLDPRTKIAATGMLMVGVLLTRSFLSLAPILLAIVVIQLVSRIPTTYTLRGMRLLLVRRPEEDVAASLLQLRRRLGTPDSATLGVDPGDSASEESGTVEDRVARQVVSLARRIEESGLAATNGVETVDYAELCADPRAVVSRLLAALGSETTEPEGVPDQLEPGPGFAGLDPADQDALTRALDHAKEDADSSG